MVHIEKAKQLIDPVFLDTPQYVCEPLGQALGCQILLKVETQNPIRSFKGRGSDFLVSELKDKRPVFCASAGNFGQAMAYACRKRSIQLTVYACHSANEFKVERMRSLGANVVLFGEDFETAKAEAKQTAENIGARFVEDSIDLETLAGAGTIGLELLRAPEDIDFLLIALGNGALLSGTATVFKERRPETQIVAVQAEGAPAMIESLRKGEIINYNKTETIADGISVRLPIPQTLEDMDGLVDEGLLVKDKTIVEAMKLLHKHSGLVVEPSSAVGVAAILENPEKFRNRSVATIICGSNVTEDQLKNWLC